MFMSHACEYGVRALIHLNGYPQGTFVPVRRIALERHISPSFLSKVVRQLVTGSLLRSMKGPGGGVCLSRPADRILLLDIVRAIDGLESFNRCAIGDPRCHDQRACPVHSFWEPIRQSVHQVLSKHTLDDLSRAHVRAGQRTRTIRRGAGVNHKRNKGA